MKPWHQAGLETDMASNIMAAAALEGALVALVQSDRDYRLRRDADTRTATRVGQDASTAAQSAVTAIEALVNNGDIIRISVDTVSDFLAGLSLGGNQEDAPASPTPSSVPLLERPIITEALAVAPQQWPPAANDYDDKGNIQPGNAWLNGQNAATGMVLGFAEDRAFLLGLAQSAHPTSFLQAQFYRAAHGLSNAMVAAGALSIPMTQAQYDAAWARMLGLSSPAAALYSGGLISSQIVDGPPLANTMTETELAEIAWPAGLLSAPGQVAVFTFGGIVAGNSTMTGRLRLDSAAGTTMAQLAMAVTTANTKTQKLVVTRRADAGGLEVYECASDSSDAAVTDIISLAPGSAHKIVWTGQWAASAVGNTTTAKTAILDKH